MRTKQLLLLAVALVCLIATAIQIGSTTEAWSWLVASSQAAPRPAAQKPDTIIPRPSRRPYPAQPTVAVLDFGVDRDTYLGERAAIDVARLIAATLGDDARFRWVERARIDTLIAEHGLQLAAGWSASQALELGQWASADLLVTGLFVDVHQPQRQALELAVIEATTGGRVATRRVPVPLPLAAMTRWPQAMHEQLTTATREAIAEAHTKLQASAKKRVVSLLFFRNASPNDRLTYLEPMLAQRLEELAIKQERARLVRISEAGTAMDEQELALLGLTTTGAEAWQSAADYYLWGQVEEQKPATGGVVAPEDVPVVIRLFLWNGAGDVVEVAETAKQSGLDAALARAAERTWAAAAAEPPPTLSLRSRDELVRVVRLSASGFSISTGDDNESWNIRRFRHYLAQAELTWFLDPMNAEVAQQTLFFTPPVRDHAAYIDARRWLARVDRATRRFGYASLTRHGADAADRMLEALDLLGAVIDGRRFHTHSHLGSGRSVPPDMPPEARRAAADDVYRRLIAMGHELRPHMGEGAEVWATPQRISPVRALDRVSELEVIDAVLDGPEADASLVAEAWEVWWPHVEAHWRQHNQLGLPLEQRSWISEKQATRLRLAYAATGRPMIFDGAPPTESTTPPAPSVTLARRGPDVGAARALIATRPTRAQAPASEERAKPGVHYLDRFLNDPTVPEAAKERMRASRALRERTHGTPTAESHAEPRHSDAPFVDVGTIELPGVYPEGLKPRLAPQQPIPSVRSVHWFNHRLAMLFHGLPQGPPEEPAGPHQLHQFDPLTLGFSTPMSVMPAKLRINDFAIAGGRRWLATEAEGLIRIDIDPIRPTAFTGEHGVNSRNITHVAALGDRLLYIGGRAGVGIVGDLLADRPTFRDVNAPEIGEPKALLTAGNAVLIRGDRWWWLDANTAEVTPLDAWLSERASVQPEALWNLWASDDAFWFHVAPGELLRVSPDRATITRIPSPIPPYPNLIMHASDGVAWFAYSWHSQERRPAQPGAQQTAPLAKSRVVAKDLSGGRLLGQFNVDGKVTAMASRHGELYLIAPNGRRDIVIVDRARVERLLGRPLAPLAATPRDIEAYGELGWAAFTGDAARVTQLLDAGRSATRPLPGQGQTPLVLAVRGGQPETTRLLLTGGADPNFIPDHALGISPFHVAAMSNRPDLLAILHERGGSVVSGAVPVGKPIHAATMQRAHDAMRWLLAHGAERDPKPYIKIEIESTFGPYGVLTLDWGRPLMFAIANEDVAALKILVDSGENPSYWEGRPELFIPPLSYAILHQQTHLLAPLLAAGADQNQRDTHGSSPLDYALTFHDESAALQLLEAGADPERTRSPLVAAVGIRSQVAVKRLLEAGVDVNSAGERPLLRDLNISVGFTPTTAAAVAAETAQLPLLDLLTNAPGFNWDAPCGDFRQGDLIASGLIQADEYARAADLVERGYSVDVPRWQGATSLMRAARYGTPQEVRLLLLLGADPTRTDEDGVDIFSHSSLKPENRKVLEEFGVTGTPGAATRP